MKNKAMSVTLSGSDLLRTRRSDNYRFRIRTNMRVTYTWGAYTDVWAKRCQDYSCRRSERDALSSILNRKSGNQIRTDKSEELLAAILEVNQIQISAMRKKQPIHNHIYVNTDFQQHLKNAL